MFLYEYYESGKLFIFDDLDIILCNRLAKQKDENKFVYLFKCFESIDSNLLVKMKNFED